MLGAGPRSETIGSAPRARVSSGALAQKKTRAAMVIVVRKYMARATRAYFKAFRLPGEQGFVGRAVGCKAVWLAAEAVQAGNMVTVPAVRSWASLLFMSGATNCGLRISGYESNV